MALIKEHIEAHMNEEKKSQIQDLSFNQSEKDLDLS